MNIDDDFSRGSTKKPFYPSQDTKAFDWDAQLSSSNSLVNFKKVNAELRADLRSDEVEVKNPKSIFASKRAPPAAINQ